MGHRLPVVPSLCMFLTYLKLSGEAAALPGDPRSPLSTSGHTHRAEYQQSCLPWDPELSSLRQMCSSGAPAGASFPGETEAW